MFLVHLILFYFLLGPVCLVQRAEIDNSIDYEYRAVKKFKKK